jgi:hypothetical protein
MEPVIESIALQISAEIKERTELNIVNIYKLKFLSTNKGTLFVYILHWKNKEVK